jgi:hypothetical protein
MSITITSGLPDAFVDQFSKEFYHTCQQKESLFGRCVRVEPILNAEDKSFDILDQFSLTQKDSRNTQTPTTDPSVLRRWCTTDPWHQAVLFDKDDDLSMIIDPTGDFQTGLLRAVNRKKDDIILACFEATVQAGRRYGDSTVTWASELGNTKYTESSGGRTIPHDCSEGNCSSSDTGMTVEKAELILEYFAKNEVDEEIPIFCAINPRQATNLFGQQEYVSVDYNNNKPLATGRILKNWHGINWVVSNKIVKGSSNDVDADTDVYECWAWAMDGVILGVQSEVSTEMSTRDDLSYAQQVYVYMNMGAIRFDEDKVIKIECV